MLTIDGSEGEGGGQIVRSSLALSALTSTPVLIKNLRAKRSKPGLQPQHLAAVRAAAQVCQAQVRGDAIGSCELEFHPGPITPGDYRFAIGTAGSTTLVMQTVLPILSRGAAPSTLRLEGGTHNPMAPPYDYVERVYLPVLERLGIHCQAELIRPGFYPVGGGEFRVTISPREKPRPLSLLNRGELLHRRITVLLCRLPEHIAQRELGDLRSRLKWKSCDGNIVRRDDSKSPGNAVFVELAYGEITEMFIGIGERGVAAEKIAARVADETESYLATSAVVGTHLADQLLLLFALAGGGEFMTLPLTEHANTQIALIPRFLPVDFQVESNAEDTCVVRVLPAAE